MKIYCTLHITKAVKFNYSGDIFNLFKKIHILEIKYFSILTREPDSNLSYKGTVVIEQVVNSNLPEGIEVIPTFTFHESSVESFPVTLANNTNHSFTLQSRALCAQMEVANVMLSNVSQSDIIDIPELSFDFTDLIGEETNQVNEMLRKWNNVFSHSDTDIGFTDAVYHKIELLDDQPFKQRY